MAWYPIGTPVFMRPVTGFPYLVAGGRKVPVRRGLYIFPVAFRPFCAHPYMVGRRPCGSRDDRCMRLHFYINMLG